MEKAKFVIKLILQLALIMLITFIGTEVQKLLHIPLAGSIVGLMLFFLLLQFKIVPESWINVGADFLLKTMVFFFIPSVVGIMDVASNITMNYILFFIVIIIGTCLVALSSGYIAEKMLEKSNTRKGTDHS
ncbi:CidA/LrgA family protein [Staphylococcus epidermidis]|jgi:holin-like protein|uniref:Holin-like protein CidA n=4 Tax=Staphylococcus TaxID=1279 RepID=CIDA_STAEQ|nr:MULTISPECIES: CidA/LrgA family protein [Staphylococcus]Q5HL70.1 RecName: Full=Holin-like protein CidA [Staphylococcus epidermidis RP62A]Q8CR38.1 RecName: Full=Holin-like protein CidA [Staphylococcus epidermidis ATCC 12228]EHQ74334.1 holin-like protein CidA [Staphylococcus epidermidis VCU057]EHR88350.1 holin-like protein CidA [Staphylococcus epidermidis VCU123]EID34716.1 holin-like protein CidA [Staphylococcus epidermidis IS-250]EJD80268.1 holin-like protein CidA [Staphylococcus epidermidis